MDAPGRPNDPAPSSRPLNTEATDPTTPPPRPSVPPAILSQREPGRRESLSAPTRGIGGLHIATMVLTVLIFGLLCYALYDQRESKKALEAQIKKGDEALSAATKRIEDSETKITELQSDLDTVRVRAGVAQKELQEARSAAQRIRKEQERSLRQLNSEIARKADTQEVSELRKEAENKLGAVSTDVTAVKGDVTTVKSELATTRQDLQSTRRELLDVHEQLRTQVAKNYGELVELRRKGERDYIEFDIRKKNSFYKVGDVNLALKKADTKRQRYNIMITADDSRLEKKDRNASEPVQFLVGKDRLRYEIVVFRVDKDRITGYLSTPKDRKLAAERSQ